MMYYRLFLRKISYAKCISLQNKKVLLRERKKHTARRVASARYAALSNGGYPIQSWLGEGGTPFSPGKGGTPSSPGRYPLPPPDLGWGTPSHIQTWD